jgi:hypothetical protein
MRTLSSDVSARWSLFMTIRPKAEGEEYTIVTVKDQMGSLD